MKCCETCGAEITGRDYRARFCRACAAIRNRNSHRRARKAYRERTE